MPKNADETCTCPRCGKLNDTTKYCKECQAIYRKEYYWKNRQKALDDVKQWVKDNKEHVTEYKHWHYKQNHEHYRQKNNQYYYDNHEEQLRQHKNYREKPEVKRRRNELHKIKQYNRSRKAVIAAGDVTVAQLQNTWDQSNGLCYYCNQPIGIKPVFNPLKIRGFDHLIPLSKGGQHTVSNLVVCCSRCNSIKHTRIFQTKQELEEFRQQVKDL